MTTVDISVVICTRKRHDHLRRVLADLAAQREISSVRWEIVVVDNGPDVSTEEVVRAAARGGGVPVHYVTEERVGKSHALNTGFAAANGNFVALTDDDVRVDAGWIAALDWARLEYPRAAGFGGRVLPDGVSEAPSYLAFAGSFALNGPFVIHDWGDAPFEYDRERGPRPFGANALYRKQIVSKVGGYRTDLGFPDGRRIGGEDIDLAQRLLDRGEQLFYYPAALVRHPVEKYRLSRRYLLEWHLANGRATARLRGSDRSGVYVLGVPRHKFRDVLDRLVESVKARVKRRDEVEAFYHLAQAANAVGEILELVGGNPHVERRGA